MSEATFEGSIVATMSNNYKDYRDRQDNIVTGISAKVDKYRKQDVSEIRKALDATTPKNIADRAVYHTMQEYYRAAPQTFEGDSYASTGYGEVHRKAMPLIVAAGIGYRAAALEEAVNSSREYFAADNGKHADELLNYGLNDSSSNQLMSAYGKNPNDKSMSFQKYDSPEELARIESSLDADLNLTAQANMKFEIDGKIIEKQVTMTYSVDECREMLKDGAFKDGVDPELCNAYVKNYEILESRQLFRDDMNKVRTGKFADDHDRTLVINRLSNMGDTAIVNEASTVRFVNKNGVVSMDIDSFDQGEHVYSELKLRGETSQKKMLDKLDGLDVSKGQTHILDTLSDDMGSVIQTDSLTDMKLSGIYHGDTTLIDRMTNRKVAKILDADARGEGDLVTEAMWLRGGRHNIFDLKPSELNKTELKEFKEQLVQAEKYHDMVSQHMLRLDYHLQNDSAFRAANASKILDSRAAMFSNQGHLREMLDALKIDEGAKDEAIDKFMGFLSDREATLNRLQGAGFIKDFSASGVGKLSAVSTTEEVKAVLAASATGTVAVTVTKGKEAVPLSLDELSRDYTKYMNLKGKNPADLKGTDLDIFNRFSGIEGKYGAEQLKKDMEFIRNGGLNGRTNSFSGVAETLNAFAKTSDSKNLLAAGLPGGAFPSDLKDLSKRVASLPEFVGEGFGDTGAAAYRELFQGYVGSLAVVNDKNKIVFTSFARLDNMSSADKALTRSKRGGKQYAKNMAIKPIRQDEDMNESLSVSGRVKDTGSVAYQRTLSRRVNNKIADKFFTPGMNVGEAQQGVADAARALEAAKAKGDNGLIREAEKAVREAKGKLDLAKFETETQKLARTGKLKQATARKKLGMGRYNSLTTKIERFTKPITNILKKPGALAKSVVTKITGSVAVRRLGGELLTLIKVDLAAMLMCAPVLVFCGIVDFAADKVQGGLTAAENFFNNDIMPENFEQEPFNITGFLEMFKDFNDDFTSKNGTFRKIDDAASTMLAYGNDGGNLRYYALKEMVKSLSDTDGMVQRGMVDNATRLNTTIIFKLHTGEYDEYGNEITKTVTASKVMLTSDDEDTDPDYQKGRDAEVSVTIDGDKIDTTENFRELVCMLTAAMQYDFVNCPYEWGDHGEGDSYKGKWTAAKMKMMIRMIYKATHWYTKDFQAWMEGGEKGNIQQNPYETDIKKERKENVSESLRLKNGYTIDVKCTKDETYYERRIEAVYNEMIHMYVLKGKSAWDENMYIPGETNYGLNTTQLKKAIIANIDGYYENEEPWQLNPDGTPVTQMQQQPKQNNDGSIVTDSNGKPVYEEVEVPITYVGWTGEMRDTKVFENEVEFESEFELPKNPERKRINGPSYYVSVVSDPSLKWVKYSATYDSHGRLLSKRETYYDDNGRETEEYIEEYSYNDALYEKLAKFGLVSQSGSLEDVRLGYVSYDMDYHYGAIAYRYTHYYKEKDSNGDEKDETSTWNWSYSIINNPQYTTFYGSTSDYTLSDSLIQYKDYSYNTHNSSNNYKGSTYTHSYVFYDGDTGAPRGSCTLDTYDYVDYWDSECTKKRSEHTHSNFPTSYSSDALGLLSENYSSSWSYAYWNENGTLETSKGGSASHTSLSENY